MSLDQHFKRAVESGNMSLPVLPVMATKVMDLARDPDSSAQQLAQLIQSDQSLAGLVMRVANSAAYNSVGQMQTLQQAIARLGMQQISTMALSMLVGESLFSSSARYQPLTDRLWQHSLVTAAWARELARIKRENTEVCFLSGLLHEIGKPVALHTLVSLIEADGDLDVSLAEIEQLMQDYHQVIGVSLARKWQLPEPVIESINYIDDYFAAPTARTVVTITNAAREISDAYVASQGLAAVAGSDIVAGDSVFSVSAHGSKPVFIELNLYPEDLDLLEEKAPVVDQLLASVAG